MVDRDPSTPDLHLTEIWTRTLDYVALISAEGRFEAINRVAEGSSANEVIHRPAWGFVVDAHQERLRGAIARIRERGEDARLEVEDRSGRRFDLRLSPLVGQAGRILALATDVTAARALERAQRRLGLALDASGVGLWHWDIARDVVTWDRATRQIYGYTEDEPLTLDKVLARHPPEDRERARLHVEKALETGAYGKIELRVVIDDEVRWILATGEVSQDADGRPTELLGGVVDITDERARRERAEQASRLEAVGRLAGGIAHDFNNILAALMGNLELLEAPASLEEATELAAEARHACDRAAELVRGLMSFSRGAETPKAPVEIETLVQRATALFRRIMPETIELELDVADAPLTVLGDAARLEQVILNLLVNAEHAMDARSGQVRVCARPATPEEGEAAGFGRSPLGLVEVTDTGTGIPSEIQAQIFEPFFTTRDRGSGLGLSTSYGIVKEHGGELLFESEEGRGAVFTVLLPLHREAPEDAGERDTPARIDARGRVLLADDEPALLRVLSRALRKAGFDVIEAVNGEEARAVFARERGRIDAAVLDAVMPRGDGPSVARAIRSSGRAVPVVIMSGYVASALDSIEPVCDRFLAKPCDPKLLVSTLQELMTESASR